jgi:predicted ester cyclase
MGVGPGAVTTRFWDEVWTRKDFSRLLEILTEDFVLHVGGQDLAHVEHMAAVFTAQWFDPFPDLAVRPVVQVVEGDLVADSLVFSGTHSGTAYHSRLFESLGVPPIPATGTPIEFTQTSVSRVRDGRICEMWEDFDRVRLFQQLGVALALPEQ